jgi:hypothetical protein
MAPRDNQWTVYRRERLESVLEQMQTPLQAMNAIIFDDIEIAEVNEVFQRFKDFESELREIAKKHEAHT